MKEDEDNKDDKEEENDDSYENENFGFENPDEIKEDLILIKIRQKYVYNFLKDSKLIKIY